jgi:nicotinate-nucleotide adenylyltransferase
MMKNSGQSIGLLGGSFDPVHNGHVAIAQSFLESGFISQLWILLTPDPPHKTEQAFCDYEHRFKMLQAAFWHFENIKIKDVENRLSQPSYTIQTLKHLTEKYPDTKFYLCIGEDLIHDFKQWRDWEKILDVCELLVARRPSGQTIDLDPLIAEKTHFIDHQSIDISSTEIRNRVTEGKKISGLVPEQVQKIIKKANLYNN